MMHDYTCHSTSESQAGITNAPIDCPLNLDRISPDLQSRNDQSLRRNGNNSSCTTQPARATSSTYTEDKLATSITTASQELEYERSQ